MKTTTNAALLVMDMQSVIVERVSNPEELLRNVSKAIATAREQKIPVFFIRVGFREGAPEISSSNKSFTVLKENTKWTAEFADEWMKFHPDFIPKPEDILITKRRISAFTGSDLEVVLRGKGIQHIILTGIATSGVVLSTLREAADKDYKITVIADCCTDRDEEVHRVLTTKIFPAQADVLSLNDWKATVQ